MMSEPAGSWEIPSEVCVYTALIGEHEGLNEQPQARNSGIPFICFTDDPSLRSDSWEIRRVRPLLARDPVRSQRAIKLLPYAHLGEFRASLYIDNTVVLRDSPAEILRKYYPTSGFGIPYHSFRQTVADEFVRVYDEGIDEGARVVEQLNHYALSAPAVFDERPYWAAIQIRDHRSAEVRRVMELWFTHVLRYSRRDQLSLNAVLGECSFRPNGFLIDNHESWFHEWPRREGTPASIEKVSPLASLGPLLIRNRILEEEVRKLSSEKMRAERIRKVLEETQEVAKRVPLLEQAVRRLTRERDAALGLRERSNAPPAQGPLPEEIVQGITQREGSR